jgi:hypothetical protein
MGSLVAFLLCGLLGGLGGPPPRELRPGGVGQATSNLCTRLGGPRRAKMRRTYFLIPGVRAYMHPCAPSPRGCACRGVMKTAPARRAAVRAMGAREAVSASILWPPCRSYPFTKAAPVPSGTGTRRSHHHVVHTAGVCSGPLGGLELVRAGRTCAPRVACLRAGAAGAGARGLGPKPAAAP